MATDITMLSPGVFLEEIDKSFYSGSSSITKVGIIGGARKGPVNELVEISSKAQFIKIFGNPITTDYGSFAAMQVLSNTNKVVYYRVINEGVHAVAGNVTAPEGGTAHKCIFTMLEAGVDYNGYEVVLEPVTTVEGAVTEFSVKLQKTVGAVTTVYETFSKVAIASTSPKYIGTAINGQSAYMKVEVIPETALAMGTQTFSGGTTVDNKSIGSLEGSPITFKTKTPDSIAEGNYKIEISEQNDRGYFSILYYENNEIIESHPYVCFDSTSQYYFATSLDNSNYIDYTLTPPPSTTGAIYTAWKDSFVGTYVFTGGGDGISGLTSDHIVGYGSKGIQAFADPEAIDIDILIIPGWSQSDVVQAGIKLVENRGDAIYIIDTPRALTKYRAISWVNGKESLYTHTAFDTSFAAVYWPWCQVYDSVSKTNVWVPPSGLVASQFAFSANSIGPWSAPAGLYRGKLSSVLALETSPNQADRDELYAEANINPLVNFKNDGIVIWGQKSLQRAPSSLDRVNVRCLLNYVKKRVTSISRNNIFQHNNKITWRSWVMNVEQVLSAIKTAGGLLDYKVVMGEETVSTTDIDNNRMPGIIYIQAGKVAEYIPVSFVIYPTTVTFSEILG